MCGVLLEEELDVNVQTSDGNSILHFLVRINHSENELLSVVQKVIQRGGNVHALNKYDETPLHICAKRGLPSVAQLLIDAHANVNASTKYTLITYLLHHHHHHHLHILTIMSSSF